MLISIIVPVYNAHEFLEECVASLTGQTYENIEVLLINDGSTDDSASLCDSLAEKDSRIRVFHKENGGTHTARNLGLEQAKGEYVMFSDPDDWFDLNTIETLVQEIENYDLDVVRFNYVREFFDHSSVKTNTLLLERVCLNEECLKICRQAIGLVGEELKNPESLNFLSSVCFSLFSVV